MAHNTEITVGPSSDPAPLNLRAKMTFIHPESAANLSAWCETPLPIVGSTTVGLKGYSAGMDRGATAGTKTQSYTSFASQASSYVVGFSAVYGPIRTPNSHVEPDVPEEVPLQKVAPTREQLAALTPKEQTALLSGRRVYVNLGYTMTQTQYQNFVDKGMTTAQIHSTMRRTPSKAKTSNPTQQDKQPSSKPATRSTAKAPQKAAPHHPQPDGPSTSQQAKAAAQKSTGAIPKTTTADQASIIDESFSSTTSEAGHNDEANTSTATIQEDECGAGYQDASIRDDNTVCLPRSTFLTVGFVPGQRAQIATTGSIDTATKTPFTPVYNAIATNLASDVDTAIRSTVKNPAVRESTTWPQLVTALQHDTGNLFDEAPLVRLGLLATSLCRETHELDITPRTLFRNVRIKYSDCAINADREKMPTGKIIAMPVDAFLVFCADQMLAHNSPPAAFDALLIDVDWCAIPVTSQVLNNTFLVEYIMAHLTSSYTYGTINVAYYYEVIAPEPMEGYLTTMPSANLSHVPGAASAILVLMDVTSISCTQSITVGGVVVPVYNGSNNRPANPVYIRDIWERRYTSANIHSIRSSCFLAWNYIVEKHCALNAAGRAASFVAELAKITRPGLAVEPRQDRLAYDTDIPLAGGWYLAPRAEPNPQPLCRGSKYLISPISLPPRADDLLREAIQELMEGFNLASYSPLHLPPSSINETVALHDGPMAVALAYNSPQSHTSTVQYNINQASSIKRLSFAAHLIERGEPNYIMGTASGFTGWLYMLSAAQAANTAAFLLLNDIPVRDWAGYVNQWDTFSRTHELVTFKKEVFGHKVIHMDVGLQHELWQIPLNLISDYYGSIDPYNNRNWGSHSPVPSQMTFQWISKLKLAPTVPTKPDTKVVNHEATTTLMMKVGIKIQMFLAAISFNTEQKHPIIFDYTYSRTPRPACTSWVEQTSYLTMSASGSDRYMDPCALTVSTPTEAVTVLFEYDVEPRKLYVANSEILSSDYAITGPRMQPITYPDPPEFMDIVSAAKNYVVLPAMAALTGFAAGGPVGAVASGLGTLAGQAISDVMANRDQRNMERAVSNNVMAQLSRPVTPAAPIEPPRPPTPTEQPADVPDDSAPDHQ